MTDKARRRRRIESLVNQALGGIIIAAGYIAVSVLGELLCRLAGCGA